MARAATLRFNQQWSRAYSDEELERRLQAAEPFELFQFLGGAGARMHLLGEHTEVWYQIVRRAESATGTSEPSIIDDWVENQRRLTMGIDGLPNQSQTPTGDLPSTPAAAESAASFLGATPESAPAVASFLGGSSE